ncbi:MAG: hypothetical protein FJZ16_03545 [Candidatus Omnitrophica bacterium]|nr:hypothetical protein [Candidatus Omnitrophota bacterium]
MKNIFLPFVTVQVIFSIFIYNEALAEEKKTKLLNGYTPPFEYEARPLLEKHTKDIETIRKDITFLKDEMKKLKDAVGMVSKQSSESETKFTVERQGDINTLKDEITLLKSDLNSIKQAQLTPANKDLEIDMKARLEALEHDISGLKDQVMKLDEKLSLIEGSISK